MTKKSHEAKLKKHHQLTSTVEITKEKKQPLKQILDS